MDLKPNPVNDVLFVSFNQDSSYFVCGTERGFRVYKTDPFRLTHRRDFRDGSKFGEEDGGIGVVGMLFCTNILAFVGGGMAARYPPHKVILWDDKKDRMLSELAFRSSVKSVRLRRDAVVAVLESHVYVYGFPVLTLMDSIETPNNPKGLCCLSAQERFVLVCPGAEKGRAKVIVYLPAAADGLTPLVRAQERIIHAHDSNVAAMATDSSGALLATASEKGTIVRVFEMATGARLQEMRRGSERAEIHSLAFSPSGDWLAVASDKGTVHVFAVNRVLRHPDSSAPPHSFCSADSGRPPGSFCSADGTRRSNNKSSLHRLTHVLPSYFSSEWSLAQFRVPDYRCIAAFGAMPNTVVVVCGSGAYYKARFDPARGGEMVREEYAQLENAPADVLPSSSNEAVRPCSTEQDGLPAQVPPSPSPDSVPDAGQPPPQSGGEHG